MSAAPPPASGEWRPPRELGQHPQAELVQTIDEQHYPGFRDDIAVRGLLCPLEITAAALPAGVCASTELFASAMLARIT